MISNEKNMQDCLVDGASAGSTHERSFVRKSQQISTSSFTFQSMHFSANESTQHQQMRPKPAIEIYRPPSNLSSLIIQFSS